MLERAVHSGRRRVWVNADDLVVGERGIVGEVERISGCRGACLFPVHAGARGEQFPDPNGQGGITIQGGSNNGASNGLDPNNPTFQSAQKACQHLMPAPSAAQQHQAFSNALKQSQCMRAHGIKDFPDPQSSNGRTSIKIQGGAGSDLNPNNPLFQRAQAVCMPNAPKPPAGGNSASGSGSSGSVFGAG